MATASEMSPKVTKKAGKQVTTKPKYVKVAFFRGASLRSIPPGESKQKKCATSTSTDELDEAQLAAWVKQAAQLPGKQM
jgi:hypothetical protein